MRNLANVGAYGIGVGSSRQQFIGVHGSEEASDRDRMFEDFEHCHTRDREPNTSTAVDTRAQDLMTNGQYCDLFPPVGLRYESGPSWGGGSTARVPRQPVCGFVDDSVWW